MRILAILAIVAATGLTVGCSKKPTEAETAIPKQEQQELAVQEIPENSNGEEQQALELAADTAIDNQKTDESEPDVDTATVNAIPSTKSTQSTKTQSTKTQPAKKVTQPTVSETSSSTLITRLLDSQAEQAKKTQEKRKLEAEKAKAEQAKAEKLVEQSSVVATLPPVNLEGYSFYGDPTQPGYQVQLEIFTLVAQGTPLDDATNNVIERIVNDEDGMIGGEANRVVSLDVPVSTQFIGDISRVTNLTDATKLTIETVPDRVRDIITLGVVLYPDYAQDIINAAALTGEISDEEALIVAIAAGADPTTVSTATASGTGAGTIAAIPVPLGSGVGAGGAGGGDTTASTN
jgi:hypothetical protein